jgi:hypothetical protein
VQRLRSDAMPLARRFRRGVPLLLRFLRGKRPTGNGSR